MYAALQCGAAGARLPVVSVESHKKAPFVILTVMLLSIQAVTASGDDGPLSEVVELNLSNRCGNSNPSLPRIPKSTLLLHFWVVLGGSDDHDDDNDDDIMMMVMLY
jgi:hypothetical protein